MATDLAMTIDQWVSDERLQQRVGEALAGYMDARQFLSQCVLCAREPALAQCSAQSLFEAFLVCAQMGLLPGKHHGHVALIPRGNKVDVMPQWQGLKYLLERQEGVLSVSAQLVHVLDDFALSPDGTVTHGYDPLDPDRVFLHPNALRPGEPAGLRGGYVRVRFVDGREVTHVVTAAKIEAARKCAQGGNIWEKWYPEMAIKSIYRDAWARRIIPIAPALAQKIGEAMGADDRALGNDPSRGGYLDARAPAQLAHERQAAAPSSALQAARERVRAVRGDLTTPAPMPAASERPGRRAKAPAAPAAQSAPVCAGCGCEVEPEIADEVMRRGDCPGCAHG